MGLKAIAVAGGVIFLLALSIGHPGNWRWVLAGSSGKGAAGAPQVVCCGGSGDLGSSVQEGTYFYTGNYLLSPSGQSSS